MAGEPLSLERQARPLHLVKIDIRRKDSDKASHLRVTSSQER
jgi:hypothetical protein